MAKLKWYRDTKAENIIVMVDDIEVERFSFGSFSENSKSLKDATCILDHIFEIFADEALAYSLKQAELI